MEGLKHMPILLNLERSLDDGTNNDLTNMIQNSLLIYEGFSMEEISFFGFDGVKCVYLYS